MNAEKRFQRWLGRIVVDAETGCWLWPGSLSAAGYAHVGEIGGGHRQLHRVIYERLIGPIPEGHHAHHVCGVRRCVYPKHLVLVTRSEHSKLHTDQARENMRRAIAASPVNKRQNKTHCPQGHEYTPENTYIYPPNGAKKCRTCGRYFSARYEARKRAQILNREENGE